MYFSQIIIYFCKINSKGIKKTLKILGFTVVGILLFFATIFILLKINRVQNFIAQIVVSELSDKLKSKVSVGQIDYKLFNTISIENLYLEDLQKDTLVNIGKINASFNFWKFFDGKVLITGIELDNLCGNIVVDTLGHSNLDFVIKAFEKPKTTDSTTVEYKIRSFKLTNSSFNYTNYKHLKNDSTTNFNVNRLKLSKLNADISLDVLNKDTLIARITSFSANDKSGFELKNISAQIMGSPKGVSIPTLDVSLPNSEIQLENIKLKYDSLPELITFSNKVRWDIPIRSTQITLADLAAFVPNFKNVQGSVSLKGLIAGRISSLRFQKMEIKYGKSLLLEADLDINGLPNIDEAFFFGNINNLELNKNDLQEFVSDLTRKPFLLPAELDYLGLLKYKGNVTGFLSNLVAYGNLNTDIGSVSTDILLQFQNKLKDLSYNGTLKSSNVQLARLLKIDELGKVAFNFNTKGTKKENESIQGTIVAKVSDFNFNKYNFKDIAFNGEYDGKGFDGNATLKDDNINANFIGKIDLTKKLPILDFNLNVLNLNLYALHFTNKLQDATLSFNGKTNLVGNSLDNVNGSVDFDSIKFTNKEKTLNIGEIKLVSRIDENSSHVTVSSDYVNGFISGDFKYSTLGYTIAQIVKNYLPSLMVKNQLVSQKFQNHIDVDLKIYNTHEISEVLAIPYFIEGVSTVKGFIDERTNKIDLVGNVPSLKTNKQTIEKITLHINNQNQKLQLTSRAQLLEKNGITSLFLLASAAKDSIQTQLGWQNSSKITNAGDFKTVAKLRSENGKMAAKLTVLPSQVIISDSIWNIHPSIVDFNSDSTIYIHNFRFDSGNQFVKINGKASGSQNDSINIDMNELNLDYFMVLLKLKGVSIGGILSGKATLLSVLKKPIFEANMGVRDFKLNHKWVGNGKVFSKWDKVNSRLLANGSFKDAENKTIVKANAVYMPSTDSINVIYDATDFSIEFLTPYFESVAQNVKGFATGKIRMFGPLKAGVRFEGDVFLDKGEASIKMLRTTYYVNDSVHLTPKTIEFRNVRMYDQERNPATVKAMLNHNGLFQHMKYDVNIQGNNILALNTKAEDNDYFFGKAYANGTVRIFGDEKEANIVVNAVSQPQTKCYVQMGGASKASDNSFITFVNKQDAVRSENEVVKKTTSDFNVKVNLQIDVTPAAEMELIVDPKGGDIITGRGNGNLRVEFDTFSDIKLYGTYLIDNGYYLFTLQNLFRKEFKINKGSTISWTGDPFRAQVNIKALYPLTASLKDLDQALVSQSARSTVPVNCVLKLTEDLMKPTINFEIDLPQSDEGVKQRVRNIINTDEMMNRQIIYLLVFNKFFQPEYLRSQTSNLINNEGLSLAVSTLSAQFNSLLSQITKSNNFTFGLDYRQTDLDSRDIKAQVLYQPNNRWIVNGNFGYRIDNLGSSTNKFINDVDIEYLLTESGKFRFKIYNHTINRFLLQNSETKQGQGLGVLYKEDFANFDDLFTYYWRLLTGPGKKNKNDSILSNVK